MNMEASNHHGNGGGLAGSAMVAKDRAPNLWVEQRYPDRIVVTNGRVAHTPLATLKDQLGGVAHIVRNDDCYVLVVGNYVDGFGTTSHWFADAVASLFKIAMRVTVEIRR